MSDFQKPTPGFLGSGAASNAGRVMRGRKDKLEEAEEQQLQASPPQSGSIPQAGGQGFFKSPSDEEKVERQRKLAEMLRKRGQ